MKKFAIVMILGLVLVVSLITAPTPPVSASVGFTTTKAQIDDTAGQIARDLKRALERARDFDDFLDGQSDASLITRGYVQAEVDDLKSAINDADQLYTLYNGTGTLGATKDFKVFLSRLWGLGGIY